jgi:carboxyl-terminal processing protease
MITQTKINNDKTRRHRRFPSVSSAVPLWLCAISLFVFSSCRDDEEIIPTVSPPPVDHVSKVNDWILENMNYWYLWNDDLPASPDKSLAPDTFFESLLSDKDRFSWIQPDYKELLNALKGINEEAGYEFVLYREGDSPDQVIAQITYVKPNSSAEMEGLKRGDVITHINNRRLTTSTYAQLLDNIRQDHTVQYEPILVDQATFGEAQSVALTTTVYQENPNYMDTVFQIDGRKVGYYVYNFFAPGATDNSNQYDLEMDQVFNRFKNEGVTDLVLDLRYNSGGSESSAKNLASSIGNGITSGSVFLSRQYNPQVDAEIKADPVGVNYLTSNFLVKPTNIGNVLRNNRIYVLTSSRTASASELVINALKPFMDVFIIGDTTYGKNVGSISIYDEEDPDNSWGLQPIVVKVFNSLGQSDYENGFSPNIFQKDNELMVYPLGDQRELLLGLALEEITGLRSITSARKRAGSERSDLGSSIDQKRRSFRLNMDELEPGVRERLMNIPALP